MNTPQTPTNGTKEAAPVAAATAGGELPPFSSQLQEIVDRTSDRYKLGLEPGVARKDAIDAAWEIAQSAADAKMVPTAGEAFARIQVGRPLGLPAMASIQHIFLIESRQRDGSVRMIPCMSAKSKLALCLSRPDIIEYIQPSKLSDTEAVWIGKRVKGKEVASQFTIENARTAGLVDRGSDDKSKTFNNYNKHPGIMLSWRACGRLADMIGADILLGIATREEVEDEMAQQRAELEELAAAAGRGELAVAIAAPAQAKPPRDFTAEAEALKAQLTAAIAQKSKSAMAAFRRAYDAFKADAPASLSEEIQKFYSVEVGKARKAERPDLASAVAAPPPVPASAQAPAAPPPAATPAPGYLPPEQRGDAYDGPESP